MQTVAVILAVTGGIAELTGLAMVVREILSDRDRAKAVLNREHKLSPPREPVGSHKAEPTIPEPTWADIAEGTATRELERRITSVSVGLAEIRTMIKRQKFEIAAAAMKEIDRGDNELRQGLREILESGLRERWVGVAALAVGIVLSAAASVLSSLG